MRNSLLAAAVLLLLPDARAADRVTAGPPARWTPPGIASPLYESSPSFTADGREVHFFRADTRFSNYHLLSSRCVAGAWSKPEAPSFARAGVMEADPHVTPDGQTLYYVSDRHGGSQPGAEDLDIFLVKRDHSGDWGKPERLPEPVNSTGAELLPRLDGQGRLWFGSSREGGLGQGDIYIATFASGQWSVANAGPPISSPAFEYEAEISRDGNTAVVVANRGTRSHLYLFRREGGAWRDFGQIPAREDVFQVGPVLSPNGDRLLFAQAVEKDSGEWFVVDLIAEVDRSWPPVCG
jgi:Tol biopolymer transport system component